SDSLRPVRPASQPTELRVEVWQRFFEALMGEGDGVLGSVEVLRDQEADPSASRLRPLQAISYSAAEDELALTLGSPRGAGEVRYFIAPRRIHVARIEEALELLVEEPCGTRTLICFFNLDGGALGAARRGLPAPDPPERRSRGAPEKA
ncbi:MAG TPA: hypothetical protein VNZ05_06485, partial [Solirubrobacteraceae bacterium]|nr:hypothetical protein [Solirubrobacteraceae bacterium]